ncbi:AraC family transcriptional regulator [Streptomyces spongiae]|nr:AraC family transcriptional regulator [Streptomyces spongiae]
MTIFRTEPGRQPGRVRHTDGSALPLSRPGQDRPRRDDNLDAARPGVNPVERYRTDDIEWACQLGAQVYYPQRLVVLEGHGGLGMELAVKRYGQVTVGSMTYSRSVRIECGVLDTGYNINIATTGTVEATAGGRRLKLMDDTAGVFNPVDDTTLDHWSRRSHVVGFKLDRELVERTFQALTGSPSRRPIVFANRLDLTSPTVRPWIHLLQAFVPAATNPFSVNSHWLMEREMSSMLATGMLLSLPHSHSSMLASGADRSTSERNARRAAAMMEAHPEDPWSVEDIACAVGVAVRTLESAFRKHFDLTPRQFLRSVRLERIHEDLRSADPQQTTVAEIAYRWGFTHLGRFSAVYRQRFGVLPSETLRNG